MQAQSNLNAACARPSPSRDAALQAITVKGHHSLLYIFAHAHADFHYYKEALLNVVLLPSNVDIRKYLAVALDKMNVFILSKITTLLETLG